MRGNFSDANVFSSTLDNYTEALMGRIGDLNLPVFTGEIGDTWIYGAPSNQSCIHLLWLLRAHLRPFRCHLRMICRIAVYTWPHCFRLAVLSGMMQRVACGPV